MLPPSLRGYAAEMSGIARTNAKVTVSQLGKVVYQTTVASGPFRIQSLNSAVNGQLDMKVEEQDGSVQTFQVDNASVPYLTRPGQLSGYYIHRGDKVDMSVNAAYVQNRYTSAGLSLQGGATVTANGAALNPWRG